MSETDDTTTSTTDEQQTTQPSDEPTGADGGEQNLPDPVREVMRKERAAAREAARRADEAEKRLSEIEDSREAAETAARERDEYRAELMRERVARKLGVPDELVDRLRGDTEEALEDDATSLLGAITAREPDNRRPSGPPARDGDTPKTPSLVDQIAAAEKAGDMAESIRLKSQLMASKKEG